MNNVTYDELYELYVNQGKSMNRIAETKHIAVGKIHKLIHAWDIPARQRNEYTITEETRKKISAAQKARTDARNVSPETKLKISLAKRIHCAGHKKQRSDGYVSLYYPDYVNSSNDGYILEHVYVMEQHIGRSLESDECVHHLNRVRNDNRIENLQLMKKKDHQSLHMKERWQKRRDGLLTQ